MTITQLILFICAFLSTIGIAFIVYSLLRIKALRKANIQLIKEREAQKANIK